MQSQLFNFDILSQIISFLVIFVGVIVIIFAKNYLKGDRNYKHFFLNLILIITSVILCFGANDIYLFLSFWLISNSLLAFLIIHKANWHQARSSGIIAGKSFLIGFIFLSASFYLLSKASGQDSIQGIIAANYDSQTLIISLIGITCAAFIQSAIWPFNSWLTSSLNSPTPVSAIMHAGLINGGGILLTRFAPLYLKEPSILQIIFIFGITTAIIGSLWKLIQSDVKRMLACSTMSQMGFMVAQCGLGLFPAAIAHLFWHGMFKAYLFLSSNGAWNEKRIDLGYPPKMLNFATSLLIGIFAAVIFAIASRESLTHLDTTFFITFLAFIASSQIALSLLRNLSLKKISIATIVSFVFAAIYGLTIYSIEILLQPLNLFQPQAWSEIHSLGLALVTLLWLCKIFYKSSQKNSKLLSWIYVKALNASQPNKTTITSNRKNYRL